MLRVDRFIANAISLVASLVQFVTDTISASEALVYCYSLVEHGQ